MHTWLTRQTVWLPLSLMKWIQQQTMPTESLGKNVVLMETPSPFHLQSLHIWERYTGLFYTDLTFDLHAIHSLVLTYSLQLARDKNEASLQQGQGCTSHGLIDQNCLLFLGLSQEIVGQSKTWLFSLWSALRPSCLIRMFTELVWNMSTCMH